MANEHLTLLGGLLFLLIAIVGGGFTIKEVRIPPVPIWPRVASGVIGLVLCGYYFWEHIHTEGRGGKTEANGLYVILEREIGDTGPRGLRARGIRVTSAHGEPRVGEVVTIEFELEQVGDESDEVPVLVATYVSAEDPDGENRDFGWSRKDEKLVRGAIVKSAETMVPDKAGLWTIWPCYALDLPGGGGEDEYCRRWNTIQVPVAR